MKLFDGFPASVKALLPALLSAAVCTVSVLILSAAVLMFTDCSESVVSTFSLVALSVGSSLGGWLSARKQGEHGLVHGFLVGAALLLLFLLVGLFTAPLSEAFFTKSFAVLAAGALGGVLGVNNRKRVRR